MHVVRIIAINTARVWHSVCVVLPTNDLSELLNPTYILYSSSIISPWSCTPLKSTAHCRSTHLRKIDISNSEIVELQPLDFNTWLKPYKLFQYSIHSNLHDIVSINQYCVYWFCNYYFLHYSNSVGARTNMALGWPYAKEVSSFQIEVMSMTLCISRALPGTF